MAKVEIYTKAYCPFCSRALAVLGHKATVFSSLEVEEYSIDTNKELREKMIARSNGGYTVPQIFINDVHVGGCDQLIELEINKKLDALLAE
jgi:glutaredoxin 3